MGTAILVTFAVAVGAVASAAPAPTGNGKACLPTKARPLVIGNGATVYGLGPKYEERVYGCLDATGQSSRLVAPPGQPVGKLPLRVTLPEIKGALVGYAWETQRTDTTQAGVAVLNLRTRHVVRSATAIEPRPAFAFYGVSALRMSADGGIAWIGEAWETPGEGALGRAVGKSDSSGTTFLEENLEIKPVSLELHGSRLSWQSEGQKRVAHLG